MQRQLLLLLQLLKVRVGRVDILSAHCQPFPSPGLAVGQIMVGGLKPGPCKGSRGCRGRLTGVLQPTVSPF